MLKMLSIIKDANKHHTSESGVPRSSINSRWKRFLMRRYLFEHEHTRKYIPTLKSICLYIYIYIFNWHFVL